MAAAIDARTIALFSSLPETTINTIAENPTQEVVSQLLQAIENKAKEYEQFKSQKVKIEVELETHIRTSESKAKVLQNSRDKALADVSKLRVELQSADAARAKAESELEAIKQSTSSESTEICNLKSRISSLEASNQDTLALLESKTSSYDRLSQEISAQHQKVVDLRKQVSALEQANQAANSIIASAKFREQGLQQELDLQKKNIDWLENERKIKSEEHSTFRKEKNARVSELTQANERYIDEVEALRRAETALKTRLQEQVDKNEGLLQQIQRLREQEISSVENHRIEVNNVTRLAELQRQSYDTARQRVQELSAAIDEVRDEAANEIGRIRAEIEAEHEEREAAEQRITELEARISELQNDLDQSRVQPSTPRREINGNSMSTPLRPDTPIGIFTPASASRMKGNLTVSQLYGEYKKLEKDLISERRMNEQLQQNVDSMLEDLEASKPEIEELRLEQKRLQTEILEMSAAAEQINQERDAAIKEARIIQGKSEAVSKELQSSQQSLRDRNSQLRWLLMDRELRANGESFSEEQFAQMQQAAAQAEERDSAHLSDTQRIVNQRLVLFRSVEELQEQNESQLTTIRNLVERLDSAEAQETLQRKVQLESELEDAQKHIKEYQDEIKSMLTQSKSYAQERDMFRNMLTRRGQLQPNIDPTDFSRSMPLPSGGPPVPEFGKDSSINGENDYAKLLKDLQAHFDSYRQETATDNSAMKGQINDLSKRNSNLQVEASKIASQLSAANQRCEMLQANYDMLKSESQEMKKRSDVAIETSARQEARIQQAAEDLVEARGLVDSLRRESANLKAEKDLWKSVEARMRDDNESLRNERSRLDQLNSSLQNLVNEREQADTETRRRLQIQVESLEAELQTSKRKLNDELDENKKTALKREYEHGQSQKRIDDLVTSLGNTREELAAAKTARDHLQARVDEMTVELRFAEERLEVFTRPDVEAEGQVNGNHDDSLTKEQELTVEVSELKRDLVLRTCELERANEQVEVYKGIAQSAEERLQELSETNEQYRQETETIISEKDARIKDLEQRIEDINSELSTTSNELSTLRSEQGESNRRFEEQKALFEAEIARLKDAEERMAEQVQFNLEATRAQAEIATEAQQSYEMELVKHAEAAKTLNTIRTEVNQYKLEIAELKTEAANARSDLEQKESSWSDLRDRYEREIGDLKKRREEIGQQNTLLHGQLENLTQQITALQRDRAALADANSTDHPEGDSKSRQELQEVINYLRREKEIIDVQYHLASQEQKRLRQQIEFLQSQLDDARLKLDQQQRSNADSERNAISHKKLMETLNELNLFRESSVTLRAEAKQAREALANKTVKLQELEERIQPLQARITELENLSELRDGEKKLLEDDRDHWQQRCQNILSKYDRVDPTELESLKTRLLELERERDDAVAAQAELQAQVAGHPETVEAAVEAAKSDLRNRLGEQFKARNREMTGKIRDKQAELDVALGEKTSLEEELVHVKEELAAARDQVANVPSPTPTADQSSTNEAAAAKQSSELAGKVAELEAKLAAKEQEIISASSAHETRFKARESQMKEMLNKRLQEVKQELNAAKQTALDDLRQKLTSAHEQELESLRAQSVPVAAELQQPSQQNAADAAPQAIPTFETLMENLTETQAKQLVQGNETIKNILRNNIRKAGERLRSELAAAQPSAEQQATNNTDSAASNKLEQSFELQKEALIKQKEEEFAAEKEALEKEFEQKLEDEKQAIIDQKDQEFADERLEFSKESERKIAEQVANAQALVEKRSAVKFNMADNRARMAQAKLDVVKKAAEETPEKAVNEVWDVAKDTKPTPQQAAKSQNPPTAGSNAQVSGSAQASPAVAQSAPTSQAINSANNATPAPAGETVQTEATASETKVEDITESTTKAVPSNVVGTGAPVQRQPSSGLPQLRGGSFRGGRGGSSLPQPQANTQQGQATRGSSIPRGGGRGRAGGRAGAQNVQTNVPSANNRGGSANSPSRGNLNPNAQQFTPGAQKRVREDGDADGGLGKRIRGGGNGS